MIESTLFTWVEHVEVEDMLHTHQIFKDFVRNYNLYGAESWIKELQRMCERSSSFYAETIPTEESIGVIQTIEWRRSVMKFAHRMVKIFYECLTKVGQLEFQNLNLGNSIGGVRVSLHQASIGHPNGIIVVAATTLWLPLPAEYVFEFLKDPMKRYQWDVMAYANLMYEIDHISNGLYPASIFQSYWVKSEDSKNLHILSTGFGVCSSEQPNANFEAFNSIGSSSGGGVGRGGADTLLTLAYQILTCSPNGIDQHQNMKAFATFNTLLSTSVLKVKNALMNST
ncbi:homeobox-leucine zipper protein ROC8-like [Trifolium pratense]|uniref:homeobox-leucine zipper protein ROC8-like n=1 Tax=Trifolium pratense TaxID=57577 RepID=UPI001E6974DC|nr:homeobox-leucine zipper protein ROC8-like [Trifolium pratense]